MKNFSSIFILILSALYLISCFTPLRLEHDVTRYFDLKDCLEFGCNVNSTAAKDFLPPGYPALLLALSKAGLLSSFTIAFINAIYLFCSLVLTRKIMGISRPVVFYTVVLLNWTVIKFFAYPLSEMQYLFFSTASLYCFWKYSETKEWKYLLLSFLLAGIAVFTRTVGFALLPALVISFAWQQRKKLSTIAIMIISSVAILGIALWKMPGLSTYISSLFTRHPNDPDLGNLLLTHIKEWGQLFLNMPIGKIRDYLPANALNAIFLLAGIFLIAWLIYALRLAKIPLVISLYIIIYFLIVFKWPHFDPRFWLPIIPFLAATILKTPLPTWKMAKPFSIFIISSYMLLGFIAFGFSLYTQFNKEAFARTQANGNYRKEYEMYFFGKPVGDTSGNVDTEVLRLLEKYD